MFVCFGWCWVSLFFSPPSDCSSLPSTMTWTPCPHGVRTRGKTNCASHDSLPAGASASPTVVRPATGLSRRIHQGKVRRSRLVLAAQSERRPPPAWWILHDLVYGHAVDASPEPEWLVKTDGQQPERWRLLHNSFGPGQRCSVGSFLRCQPTPCTDYTFETLHRVCFYDPWRESAPGV